MRWSALALIFGIFGLAPQWSMALGLFAAVTFKLDDEQRSISKQSSSWLLQASVALLGASLPLTTLAATGSKGLMITFGSVLAVLAAGKLMGRFLQVDNVTGALVSFGTAICGGSAIAALSPVAKASGAQMTMALTTVFLLNAAALFIFPPLGRWFELSQEQFGFWSALAIHDTSSVVGAASAYGEEALKTATTLKLTRALWIVPFTALFAFSAGNGSKKAKFPRFILVFVGMSLVATIFDEVTAFEPLIKDISKRGMSASLFLIGLNFQKYHFHKSNYRVYLLGFFLWAATAIGSLLLVLSL